MGFLCEVALGSVEQLSDAGSGRGTSADLFFADDSPPPPPKRPVDAPRHQLTVHFFTANFTFAPRSLQSAAH